MKEGLLGPKVENVAVAIVQDIIDQGEPMYYVYLLNLRDDIMEGVIINSVGYGDLKADGEQIRTSTLRHTLEILLPEEAAKLEPIMEDVFGLSNEYWVSFWVNEDMYDKKFVFLPNTISAEKMEWIPLLGKKGLLIR
jgi:hypothetical protein